MNQKPKLIPSKNVHDHAKKEKKIAFLMMTEYEDRGALPESANHSIPYRTHEMIKLVCDPYSNTGEMTITLAKVSLTSISISFQGG